jgi:hypothetical protein
MKRTERERSENYGVMSGTIFKVGNKNIFTALQVPRLSPLVFLVEIHLREGKT